jgi:predicted RNA binding protein YcfA (HicA-like mRNA interferase family)
LTSLDPITLTIGAYAALEGIKWSSLRIFHLRINPGWLLRRNRWAECLNSVRNCQERSANLPLILNGRNPTLVPVDKMKVRDIIRLIEADGWFLDRTRGSHRQYKHSTKRGLVTVAGKPGDDLAPGTKNSILKQSGLK